MNLLSYSNYHCAIIVSIIRKELIFIMDLSKGSIKFKAQQNINSEEYFDGVKTERGLFKSIHHE